MNVWRKKSIRYVNEDGKQVSKNDPKAKRKIDLSKRFYGTLRTASGKRKQIPLTEERASAETLLRRLQTDEDRMRAVGYKRHDRDRLRPIDELLGDYESYLRSKANTKRWNELTMTRIRLLIKTTKTKTVEDLDATRIARTLASWRERKELPITTQTSNHYARAIKGFSRWLWTERRTQDDPLTPLRMLNASVDRRHQRRALTIGELQRLIRAAETSPKAIRAKTLAPADRAMLYTLAAMTGLRASELASLVTQNIDLERKTISVSAAYSKRRRNDTLPLHGSLIEKLRPWLATKTGTLFPGTWPLKAAKIIKRDLKRAGVDYVDESGRYADFHALRHTFITQLARAGVHPSKAKELARHSTITLTMDVYSHLSVDELRSSVESLPSL